MSERPHVTVDPRVYSGQPTIRGLRIPTRMIAEIVYERDERPEWILENYDITRDDVLVACWFEATHGRSRKLRKVWRDWATENFPILWRSGSWDGVPYPPVEDTEEDHA